MMGGRDTGWKLKGTVENEVRESLLLAERERGAGKQRTDKKMRLT